MRLAVFEGLSDMYPDDFNYGGFVDDLLNSQVKAIKIDTAYGPPIVIDRPFAPAPPKPVGEKTAADYLKPRIEIQLDGSNPITWAPYGDPRPGSWGWIKFGLVSVGVLALIGASGLLKKKPAK
jgi:hypothetical protein